AGQRVVGDLRALQRQLDIRAPEDDAVEDAPTLRGAARRRGGAAVVIDPVVLEQDDAVGDEACSLDRRRAGRTRRTRLVAADDTVRDRTGVRAEQEGTHRA